MTRDAAAHPVLEQLKAQHADNYGWALTCCSWQCDIAEDLLQESYLRVLDGRARYGGKAALKTWFFAVIRTVAKEMQRAGKRRQILNLRVVSSQQPLDEAGRETHRGAPDQHTQQEQSNLQLREALQQLPQRQREVLHLVFYAQCTLEETASTLQLSIGTVRTHYHRGKSQLAVLLDLENYNDY